MTRQEAEEKLSGLPDKTMDELERAYSRSGHDEWAFGRKAHWMCQEAIRLGYLLGPA